MANEQPKYTVLYQPGAPLQRAAETILTWSFLAFIVWLSKGSTWWTFLFGTIALLAIAGRFKYLWDNYTKRFSTKAELRAFVDSLPE